MIRFLKRSFLFLFIIGLFIFLYKRDYLIHKLDPLIVDFSDYTDHVLKEVYLSGRINETKKNIIEAINVNIGDSLFDINLKKIRENLNMLPWVEDSKIYILPFGQLEIEIFEYIPFGIFVENDTYSLINDKGNKFKKISINEFSKLLKIRGEDALIEVKELSFIINKLKSFNLVASEVERIDSRRWNIYLREGYFIKLPQIDAINSLDSLYELGNNINYDNLIFIDLRIKNRISIKYKHID